MPPTKCPNTSSVHNSMALRIIDLLTFFLLIKN